MRTIRHFSSLLIILCFFTITVSAQTTAGGTNRDTTKTPVDSFLNQELNRSLSAPYSTYRDFSDFHNQNISVDTSSLWLQTRMLIQEPMDDDPMKSNFRTSILNPLNQKFDQMESMKVINYILGTVQAGAAGYFAYQHIKKYGFLKKK